MSSIGDSTLAYCYRRTESQVSKLLTNFGKLFTDQSLFDCSIICEGKVIKGHKFMLAASSDYFKAAFTSFNNTSCSNSALIIGEVPYDDLRLIIDYIYQGEIIIPSSQLSSLQRSCQWLKINCFLTTATAPSTSSSSASSTSSTSTPATGLIPITSKKVSKVKSLASLSSSSSNDNLNYNASSNKIKVKLDSSDSMMMMMINKDILSSSTSSSSSSSHEIVNGHANGNLIGTLNRVPSLLYSNLFRSTPQMIKIVDPIILNSTNEQTNGSSVNSTTATTMTTSTSTSSLACATSTSPLLTHKTSPTNETRRGFPLPGEPFVQLRELLRREPNQLDNGNGQTDTANGEVNGEDKMEMQENDHDEERRKVKEELIVEEEEEDGDGDDENDDEEEAEVDIEEEQEQEEDGVIENDEEGKGQTVKGQQADNAGYLSSEEFEIDIPRSNEEGEDNIYYHHQHHQQKMDQLEGDNNGSGLQVEAEMEEEMERQIGKMEEERVEGGEEEEEEEEEEVDEDEDEDEVIDMRVNASRRFDGLQSSQLAKSSSTLHHASNTFKGSNLNAAAAAAVTAAVAAAVTGGSTSLGSNLVDECPSGDSLDLDCGDKLRATANYSMIPFTASIASSFTSATARAIAASTTLAVASGLLSKQQQQQQQSHTHLSLNGINGSSLHHLHSQQHHHQQQHNETLFKTLNNSSNCDYKYDPSDVTVPLKRGRGRPPRHLRETTVNGSSSSSSNLNSSNLEPLRSTFKIRNILPSGTSSDLILQSNNSNTNNSNTTGVTTSNGNHLNGTNHVNGNSNCTANNQNTNHQIGNHIILSTSSNLGLTLKRKIRLTNHGLIGLVSGSSPKGRKPKLGSHSIDHSANGKNVCPYCPQVYYSNQAMNDHINNVHTGNSRKYTCDLCSKEFSWKISLTKHLRNSHKPENNKSEPELDTRQLTLM